MARPTILIGIGSGGFHAVEYAWKLSQEISSENRPVTHYIYLETDGDNESSSPQIISSPITLPDSQTSVHAIKQDPNHTTGWLNGQSFPTNALNGAGGNPAFGRLCIWDLENRQRFITILQQTIGEIVKTSLETPLVYVTGSFGGGTGSGIFLDIAYIIREALANQVELQGLFLLPNIGEADTVMYCNTLGALKALDYYSSEDHEFSFKWGPILPRGYEAENSPYDLVQIISSEYHTTLGKISYSELQEDAGLFLYLNSLGLYDTRRKSLVDATGNIIITKYSTFGLSALRYPQTQIKEILSLDLSLDLLKRWVDGKYYYDKYNNQKTIEQEAIDIKNQFTGQFESKFGEIIEKWCESVELFEDGQTINVDEDLRSLSKELNSGNVSYDEKRKKVYNYFRNGGRYYDLLKAKASTGVLDPIIVYIKEVVSEILSSYENLVLAKSAVEAIHQSISNILNYWGALGVTEDVNSWHESLKSMVLRMLVMPWDYKLLQEQEKVYFDRLKYELLYGLAMHILYNSIVKIKNGLSGKMDETGRSILIKDSNNRIELPSTRMLRQLQSVIEQTIKSEDANICCTDVRNHLYTKLKSNNSKTIYYVFPKSDLDTTLVEARINYNANHPGLPSVKDITGNDDLWGFLCLNAKDSTHRLYHSIVDTYVQNVVVEPYSVSEAVNDPKNENIIKNIAQKGTIPHLPANPSTRKATFKDHDKIPHVLLGYAGNAGNELMNIDQKLQKLQISNYIISNQERHALSHEGLNNWLIFYKEFGYMTDNKPFTPTFDLRDFDNFCSIYSNEASKNDAVKFHGKRIPYIAYDACKQESTKYINQAMYFEAAREYQKAIEAYKIARYWDIANTLPVQKIAALNNLLVQESVGEAYQRYIDIAAGYLGEKDYDMAEFYYRQAENKMQGQQFVIAQIKAITEVRSTIYRIVEEAERLCPEAHALYNQWLLPDNRANTGMQADCLAKYQTVLNKLQEAQKLSPKDAELKKKISSINNFINRLTA